MTARAAVFVLASWMLLVTVPAFSKPPGTKWFNTQAFVGMTALSPNGDGAAYVLDTDTFDKRDGGTVATKNCQQVGAVKADDIKEQQYSLFQLLATNCLALEKFMVSQPARKSFFQKLIGKNTVLGFPATALPVFSPSEDLHAREGKLIRSFLKVEKAALNPDKSIHVETESDVLTYRVMARADFDGDGAEDILVRVDWSAKDGRGRIFDLFLLSKKSVASSIDLVWRK